MAASLLGWRRKEEDMEPNESTYTEKSEWGPGPWQDEHDRIEWRDEATGLPCLIVRGGGGALCGYVAVSPGHPYHGVNGFSGEPAEIEVHGGITFGSPCIEGGKICHVPQPGESDDVYWLGFDCGHYMDVRPMDAVVDRRYGFDRGPLGGGATYKTVDYVRDEVTSLARQLASVTAPESETP